MSNSNTSSSVHNLVKRLWEQGRYEPYYLPLMHEEDKTALRDKLEDTELCVVNGVVIFPESTKTQPPVCTIHATKEVIENYDLLTRGETYASPRIPRYSACYQELVDYCLDNQVLFAAVTPLDIFTTIIFAK